MSLAELAKQSGGKKVNDNKDVKISVVKRRKITTTIASAKPISGKLPPTSTKMSLPNHRQDLRVKRV